MNSNLAPPKTSAAMPVDVKIVLLAGLLCDDTIWAPQRRALSAAQSVSVYHFPSHDTITEMALDVLDTTSGPLIVAGHSMGGRVALEIARLAPDRVSGLALLNTGVHPAREGEGPKRQELIEVARRRGMGELADSWLPPMIAPDRHRDVALIEQLTQMVCRSDVATFERQIGALLRRPDARSHLGEISCPTVLASGTLDTWSPLSQHAEMNDLIKGSKLLPISGSGHMSLAEEPAQTRDALFALLELVRRTGRL